MFNSNIFQEHISVLGKGIKSRKSDQRVFIKSTFQGKAHFWQVLLIIFYNTHHSIQLLSFLENLLCIGDTII